MKRAKAKWLLLIAAMTLMGACATEESRTEPVKTTTEGAGTAVAPAAKDVKARDNALVRFVHAMPWHQAMDAFVDDAKTFGTVEYKLVTAYQEVPGKQHTFRLVPTAQPDQPPLAAETKDLDEGKHYTVIALPSTDTKTPTLRVIEDNLTPPAAGKAKVRVIHASPDAGAVAVFAVGKDKALFDSVSFNTQTDYTELDPFNGALEVRQQGRPQAVLLIPPTKLFEAGKLYTIILIGQAKATPGLEAITVEDQLSH